MKSKNKKKKIINLPKTSVKYGLAAGLSMSFTLFIFQTFSFEYAPYLKLTKYIFLIGFLAALMSYLREVFSDNFFIKGMGAGLRAAFVAGLTLSLINILIYAITPEFAFSKYTLVPDRVFEAVAISAILLFETFVFGGIITFIFLQMLKDNTRQLSEAIE